MRSSTLYGLLFASAALMASPSRSVPLSIGLNFEGTTSVESGFIPPDTMGGVSEDYVVEFVNGRFAVYDKNDGSQLAASSLDRFWIAADVVPNNFAFDPRILYDPTTQRWFAASVDDQNNHNNFLVAVSDSADPTGTWSGFAIPSDSNDPVWADYPMLGLNDTGVFVSANMFDFQDNYLFQANVLTIPKADLVLATPTVANATVLEGLGPLEVGISPQPVVDLDGSASQGVLLSEFSLLGFLFRADIQNPMTAPSIGGTVPIPVTPFEFPGDAPQPGSLQDLDICCSDSRFQANVVLRDGSIWAVSTVLVDGLPGVRWLEIDEATNIVLQSGVIADNELAYYYPSIAVNEFDEVVIGLNGSSETQFVSSYAVVGGTSGGVTTFGAPMLLAAGSSSYLATFANRNRWGDYSATVVDPSDPHTFWTFQEIPIGFSEWAVQITELHVPEPATALLLACGLAGLTVWRGKRAA